MEKVIDSERGNSSSTPSARAGAETIVADLVPKSAEGTGDIEPKTNSVKEWDKAFAPPSTRPDGRPVISISRPEAEEVNPLAKTQLFEAPSKWREIKKILDLAREKLNLVVAQIVPIGKSASKKPIQVMRASALKADIKVPQPVVEEISPTPPPSVKVLKPAREVAASTEKEPKKKTDAINVVLVGASILIAAAAGETVARIADPDLPNIFKIFHWDPLTLQKAFDAGINTDTEPDADHPDANAPITAAVRDIENRKIPERRTHTSLDLDHPVNGTELLTALDANNLLIDLNALQYPSLRVGRMGIARFTHTHDEPITHKWVYDRPEKKSDNGTPIIAIHLPDNLTSPDKLLFMGRNGLLIEKKERRDAKIVIANDIKNQVLYVAFTGCSDRTNRGERGAAVQVDNFPPINVVLPECPSTQTQEEEK